MNLDDTRFMQLRQESEMSRAMSELNRGTKTDYNISMLSRNHLVEREGCQEKWMLELTHLRQTQKAEYRDWVTKGYEQMNADSSSTRDTGTSGLYALGLVCLHN